MVAATNTPAGSFIVATVESGLVTGPAFFVFRPLWFYTTNRGDRMDWCCTAAVPCPRFGQNATWASSAIGARGPQAFFQLAFGAEAMPRLAHRSSPNCLIFRCKVRTLKPSIFAASVRRPPVWRSAWRIASFSISSIVMPG